MKNLAGAFLKVVFLLFLFSFFPTNGYASSLNQIFFDDFNTIDNTHWNIFQNGGDVSIVDFNAIKLSANSDVSFPYIYSNLGLFPDGEYTVDFKFLLNGPLNYGSGLVFSDNVLSNQTLPDIEAKDIIFEIWPESQTHVGLWTTMCPIEEPSCSNTVYRKITSMPIGTYHTMTINQSDGKYKVNIDTEIPKSFFANKKIAYFWLGNPQKTSTLTLKPSIVLDYFKISIPEKEKVGVVILPGFGGSWDVSAILNDTEGTNWKIPPFIKNYDGIIQSFKNAGYVEGTDLFVFGYDWRKKLTDLADDLNTYINNTGLSKINLVGHSMGGLVARSYGQKYGVSKIDKILTIGTPHMGVTDMYGLWEGAKIWNGAWWQNALLEINSEVYRNPGETKIASIRRNSPSIIDLFPTFSFLFSNGVLNDVESMQQKNLYLKNLNNNFGALSGILIPFWSDDIAQTKNRINTINRLSEDILLERWEDGKPSEENTFGNASGDGTVTKESAVGPFGAGEKIGGWHGDLLANLDNNKKILEKLGLDSSFASASGITDNRQNAFIALLRSPGKLEVCDELNNLCNEALGGINFESNKLFILPGYSQEKLLVKVKEDGFGDYKLYMGNIDGEPDWQLRTGKLDQPNQVDKYYVTSDGKNIATKQDNVINFLSISDKTFGETDFVVSATASSGLLVTFKASGDCTISTNVVHLVGFGNCTVVASQLGNDMYLPATDVTQSFAIYKATLTITAEDKTRQYSDLNPTLTYKASVNAGYSGKPSCTTTATVNSPIGSYPIVCTKGTLTSTNFEFAFVDGKIKVEKEKVDIIYAGDWFGITWGKNKTADINLRALLVQDIDRYLGDLKLAKIIFEVTTKDGRIVSTNKTTVDRFGIAGTRISGLKSGDYLVKIYIDPDNVYWRSNTTELVKLKVYSL